MSYHKEINDIMNCLSNSAPDRVLLSEEFIKLDWYGDGQKQIDDRYDQVQCLAEDIIREIKNGASLTDVNTVNGFYQRVHAMIDKELDEYDSWIRVDHKKLLKSLGRMRKLLRRNATGF